MLTGQIFLLRNFCPIVGPVTTGLRERKKAETRRELSAAAVRLCLARGYELVTVADIADAAGVSRRTFSNYFAGKAECVAAFGHHLADEIVELAGRAPAGTELGVVLRRGMHDFADRLDAGFDDFMLLMQREPDLMAAGIATEAVVVDQLAGVLAALSGTASSDIRVRAFAVCCISIVKISFDRWIADGRPDGTAGLDRLLERAFSVVNTSVFSA